VLGNATGGLSGPAIKPVVLRIVWQVARAKVLPIMAAGGIATIDDAMEFLIAGASAVQIGTANFYDPTASVRIVEQLPAALQQIGCGSVREAVGLMHR
jgi:dihydroorotate dehydrogenase (NAD+) catalytic subunit